MKTRIALWAATGALVVIFWTVYIMSTMHNLKSEGGIGWVLICLTCPIALASHHAVSLYQVLVANAATYALIGAVVEIIRRQVGVRSVPN